MSDTDIRNVFISTRETLREAGVEDNFFSDLVASRLLVERVGESGNNGWWESRVLSETGRTRLAEVTPKTQLNARIDLASEVGRKAESERIPPDSISLFDFGPQMESRLTAALEQIDSDDQQTLLSIEGLSIQSLDEGWTDAIIDETEANIKADPSSEKIQDGGSGDSVLIDENGFTQDDIEREKWSLLTDFLQAYGYCTTDLQVAYYPLEAEIKQESG